MEFLNISSVFSQASTEWSYWSSPTPIFFSAMLEFCLQSQCLGVFWLLEIAPSIRNTFELKPIIFKGQKIANLVRFICSCLSHQNILVISWKEVYTCRHVESMCFPEEGWTFHAEESLLWGIVLSQSPCFLRGRGYSGKLGCPEFPLPRHKSSSCSEHISIRWQKGGVVTQRAVGKLLSWQAKEQMAPGAQGSSFHQPGMRSSLKNSVTPLDPLKKCHGVIIW